MSEAVLVRNTLHHFRECFNRNPKDQKAILSQLKPPFILWNTLRATFFVLIILAAFLWATDLVEPTDMDSGWQIWNAVLFLFVAEQPLMKREREPKLKNNQENEDICQYVEKNRFFDDRNHFDLPLSPRKSILCARISEVARFPQPHFFLRELNSECSPAHNNFHG